jgi:catechol 2,3-dioxygenase-like lactoylglutathione lyase family enzyme
MNSRLSNCATVFVTPDIKRTAAYYREIMGFRVVEHYDKAEAFAALYRDDVEIIIVQSKFGEVLSNKERYGAGYDVYLAPEGVEGVDILYSELKEKGAKIANPPVLTPYGSYEFVVEDIDGRLIGIGCIKHNKVFFRNNV